MVVHYELRFVGISFNSEDIMETSTTKRPNISATCCEAIDRISSLPDHVLHNILSYLCIFDVVQLSVLSKRWKYIWTTMPYLHFDLDGFYSEREMQLCDSEVIEKFKDFVNWVLIFQSATRLVRFNLQCDLFFDKVVVLRWIHATTRRNVQELVLSFCPRGPFELPYFLVTCESLQVLKLHLFGHVLRLSNHLGFRQLKLLHLEQIKLSDEHLTSCLFSKCHLLESLILEDCSLGDMTLLDIASTSLIHFTLRNMNLDDSYDNCKVKVSCPRLKSLKYQAPLPMDIVLENLFSIEYVSIYVAHITIRFADMFKDIGILVHKMIKEVPSTSALKLCVTSISGLYNADRIVKLSPVSCYKLKSLNLSVGVDEEFMPVMIVLLKYSPNLEVLKLWFDESEHRNDNSLLHDPDESIECLESHLKSIQLTGFKAKQFEIKLLRFFLKNARVVEALKIVWESDAHKSEETSKEVLKFPRTSSHVVLTFLDAKPGTKPRSRCCYALY